MKNFLCILLVSFIWIKADVSENQWSYFSEGNKQSLQSILQQAGSHGMSRELLERKIHEGISKGVSQERILNAVRARQKTLVEINGSPVERSQTMEISLYKAERKSSSGEKEHPVRIKSKVKPLNTKSGHQKSKGHPPGSKKNPKDPGGKFIKPALKNNQPLHLIEGDPTGHSPSKKQHPEQKIKKSLDLEKFEELNEKRLKKAEKRSKKAEKLQKKMEKLQKKLNAKEKARERKQKK